MLLRYRLNDIPGFGREDCDTAQYPRCVCPDESGSMTAILVSSDLLTLRTPLRNASFDVAQRSIGACKTLPALPRTDAYHDISTHMGF